MYKKYQPRTVSTLNTQHYTDKTTQKTKKYYLWLVHHHLYGDCNPTGYRSSPYRLITGYTPVHFRSTQVPNCTTYFGTYIIFYMVAVNSPFLCVRTDY